MMKTLLALGLIFAAATPAFAWYDRGHMIVAQLAWKKLDDRQRAQVVALLKKHPHHEEYLAAKRPDGVPEDEWVFLRAATWPDWVGTHHAREFAHPAWHFINFPFVPPGSRLDAKQFEPKHEENIVQALTDCVKKIETGADAEKAIALCWVLHLVGDIHQPLHCAAMFSEQFPKGDQGGNLVLIRTPAMTKPMKLHAFWDGLLGESLTPSEIAKASQEIETLLKDKAAAIQPDLAEHTTFKSWAKESFELARKDAYLNGALRFSPAKLQLDGDDPVPTTADYASNAERTARLQAGKAGVRLAGQLAKLFP